MRERENQNFKMYLKIALAIVALIGFIVMINQIWKTEGFREWAMWRMAVAVIFGSLAYFYSLVFGVGGVYFYMIIKKDNYGEKMNTCIIVSMEGLAAIFQLVFWGVLRSNYMLCIAAGIVAVIIAIFYGRLLIAIRE